MSPHNINNLQYTSKLVPRLPYIANYFSCAEPLITSPERGWSRSKTKDERDGVGLKPPKTDSAWALKSLGRFHVFGSPKKNLSLGRKGFFFKRLKTKD
jgi:hypothetical protein